MSSSSLRPILNLEIPDLAATAWTEVVPRAWRRSGEIDKQRLNFPEITDQYHDDYQLLHRFEYEHFYSGWVGVAFRFGACAAHNQNFTEAFKRTGGTSQGIDLYREDDALFDFFVKGLSALESFYYSLYALGALIYTPTQTPSVPPPTQFPLLDPAELLDPAKPKKLRQIKPERVKDTFKEIFPRQPITELLEHIIEDPSYKQWSQIRNVLAHRVATAGRNIQHQSPFFFRSDEPSISVTHWASELSLDETMTFSRYDWLREAINNGLEETSAFTVQQLA